MWTHRQPVLSDPARAQRTIAFLEQQYFHMPTVLLACDDREVPSSYYGRADLAVRVLHAPLTAMPWQTVTLRSPYEPTADESKR